MRDWERWRQESNEATAVVGEFGKLSRDLYGYAYEAGWWSSMVPDLLMAMPRSSRERVLNRLKDQIKKLEADQLIQKLKG